MNQNKKNRVFSFQIKNTSGVLSEVFDSQLSTARFQAFEQPQSPFKPNFFFLENEQIQSPRMSTQRSLSRLHINSLSPKNSYIYSRKSILTPQSITSQLGMLYHFEKQLADCLKSNYQIGVIESLFNLMVIAVEQDNIDLLITFMRLCALTFISFQEWTKALLFFQHCKFLSEFTRQLDVIQWTFLQIGILCKYIKKYDIGKIFIKKSLEYSWLVKDLDQEIICYEELGKLCFLNYELQTAKSLHEKSMKGNYEKEQSSLRQVSKKGMEQILNMFPQQEKKLGLHIFSKAVNFPLKFVQCQNQQYFSKRSVKNQYLISNDFECVPNQRIIEIDLTLEDMLQSFLKGVNFSFEIPTPISVTEEYESIAEYNQMPSIQKMKQTQLATIIKLHSQKASTTQRRAPIVRLDQFQQKLPLEQIIKQRLEMKFDNSYTNREKIRNRKFANNLEQIRLTHEKNGIALSLEYQKRELIRYAKKLLNQQQITFI
ncbi:unnamed protein product (macronuclear) [Paramecium tetraurelia]|uniref:Uncharacterized protein n=1 Tax=Paramecium tetraurelia TaxID=5888 RepID=A0BW70_PARTE|nr:uncharacterized protein GSPATT00032639001 [Paramecium tetraurelia]CAK62787.1 unnamed protein product [Paramecium tetraurelia]|eukprot:XP_001430185.1 hypothetical protein (macronuclear) [Paramecium tetraurelia strain d4-2]